MRLRCVDTIDGDINLTVGKTYEVVRSSDNLHFVVDDMGRVGGFMKDRFVEEVVSAANGHQ